MHDLVELEMSVIDNHCCRYVDDRTKSPWRHFAIDHLQEVQSSRHKEDVLEKDDPAAHRPEISRLRVPLAQEGLRHNHLYALAHHEMYVHTKRRVVHPPIACIRNARICIPLFNWQVGSYFHPCSVAFKIAPRCLNPLFGLVVVARKLEVEMRSRATVLTTKCAK